MPVLTHPTVEMIFGQNPYDGFDYEQYPLDLQGWSSDHPIFEQLITQLRPRTIIEVGSWKGASALHMAKILKAQKLEGTIFCVDTWLGGLEHLIGRDHPELGLDTLREHGYPRLYHQFLANVLHQGMQDRIIPVPNTSLIAARWFARHQIQADLIYIDASHDEDDVYADLTHYWQLLRPGGIMLGDDWSDHWYGVICAVNRFAREQQLPLQIVKPKWLIQKPQ